MKLPIESENEKKSQELDMPNCPKTNYLILFIWHQITTVTSKHFKLTLQ